jgi:REP-associated tyrosine transposase
MIVDALCAFWTRGLWSARTCPRFESGDMSPHSKGRSGTSPSDWRTRTRPHTPKWVLLSARLSGNESEMNWPHAPAHWLFEPGLYIVTTGTYRKLPHLNSPPRLDLVQESLFNYAHEFAWNLRAWAVLANHYHFVAASPSDPGTLRRFLGKLHMQTATQLNRLDNKPGRTVWFQFWDSHITFERSYLARLHYVHYNPSRHGIVPLAENYKWCSAAWFAQSAPPAFVKTVRSFNIDRVNVPDDF